MAGRKRKRKGTKRRNSFALIGVFIFLAFLVFFIIRWNESQKVKFIKYEAFGIGIPSDYTIHGIDVSRYQKYIGWNQVKEMDVQDIRIGFAFIKATEGEVLVDPYFKRNWREASKEEMPRGAYHFFSPTKDPLKQARHFIKQVKIKAGDMPPVLDIETTGKVPAALLRKKAKIWLNEVEKHYGVKPIIYTNADFYKKILGKDFESYPLWVAHYYERHKPNIDRNWLFWQHNDRANVNGIEAKVDFNVFNGDSLTFKELLVK